MITWLPSAYCCSKHLEHFKGEVTSTDNFIRLIFTTTLLSAYRFSEFFFRSETTSMFIHCCYDEDLFKILFSVGNAKIICFGFGNLFLDYQPLRNLFPFSLSTPRPYNVNPVLKSMRFSFSGTYRVFQTPLSMDLQFGSYNM